MKIPKKPVFSLLFISAIILFVFLIMQPLEVLHFKEYIAFLFPAGKIALEQRNMLFILQIVMLFIIIPVYILTFVFSWVYRAHNSKAKYDPDLVDHKMAEIIWWGLPFLATLGISIYTWVKTHELDPYRPIESDKKPLTIQAVALQWKWLFIYPEEKVASVNFIQIPTHTPVKFEITADAPMNSFWIPELGGQIYAMPKMKTELNLIADEAGEFRGSSANISGEGFAGMTFMTKASTEKEYHDWIDKAKQSDKSLSLKEYDQLVAPSQNNPVEIFQLKDDTLFDQIIMKYMHPMSHE